MNKNNNRTIIDRYRENEEDKGSGIKDRTASDRYLSGLSQLSATARQIVRFGLMMGRHVPSPTHSDVLIHLEKWYDD